MKVTEVIYFSIEIACFLAALVWLRDDRDKSWRIHRWYMGAVVLVELGAIIITNGFHQSTHWWYNAYILVECAFISWFLFRCIRSLKPLPWYWLYGWYLLFLVFYSADTFSQKQYALNNNSIQLMNVAFIIGCLFYYYILQRSTTYRKLSTFADFWWVNGVMYFYFSNIVLYVFIPSLSNAYVWGLPLFYVLNTLLIVIYYSTWIYAYFLRYRERKTSLASSSS